MPKISAPTVAEHRAAQRDALLAAAEELIAEAGVGAVTPRAVGERAGLARSSFYEYFASKDDLIAAVAVEAFEQWAAEVAAVTSAVPAGRARLQAYVEANIRMTADGKHALATGLRSADLSPSSRDAIAALHDSLVTPLTRLLAEAGAPDVELQAALLQGVIGAGVQLVTHGAPAEEVSAAIAAMLDAGVRL